MTTHVENEPPAVDQPLKPDVPTPQVCPHCGGDHIRESTTRRGVDLLPSSLGKTAFRCRSCRARFHVKVGDVIPDPAKRSEKLRPQRNRDPFWKRPSLKRHLTGFLIASGSIVVFAAFLFLLARSSSVF